METDKVFIIAEAGVNHNGSVETAKRMIDAATNAGADAVKFQTFKAEKVVSKFASKAEYQKETTQRDESQLEMIKKLELDPNAHKELIDYCRKNGVMFLSSPFDLESIELLDTLGLSMLKIPSGEITNLPYLKKIGSLKKKIVLSTGMSDLREIGDALSILTHAGTAKEDITVLHCNTEYPTPYEDVNLRAMLTIKETFKIKVGYSDHTPGIEVSIAAAALGAAVIEKHFTLNRSMEGPDQKASLGPGKLKAMVQAIRNVEKSLGDGTKKPSRSELKNIAAIRKSILAARNIREGEIFTEGNLAAKRPSEGISPMEWDKVIGQTAKRNFEDGQLIEL